MNPRQRRGALLMAVAVLGAAGVFYGVYRYVEDVRSQVGPTVEVMQLDTAVAAFNAIPQSAMQVTRVPRRWAPQRPVTQVDGLVAVTDLPAGSVLQEGMLTQRPEVDTDQREIAIVVSDETAVAGKVRPGNRVDIYATFPGSDAAPPSSRVVLQDVRVIAVGNPVSTPDPNAAFVEQRAVPITFALLPADAQVLTYVETFASSLRLALRMPGTSADDLLIGPDRIYAPRPGDEGAVGPSPGGGR